MAQRSYPAERGILDGGDSTYRVGAVLRHPDEITVNRAYIYEKTSYPFSKTKQ